MKRFNFENNAVHNAVLNGVVFINLVQKRMPGASRLVKKSFIKPSRIEEDDVSISITMLSMLVIPFFTRLNMANIGVSTVVVPLAQPLSGRTIWWDKFALSCLSGILFESEERLFGEILAVTFRKV